MSFDRLHAEFSTLLVDTNSTADPLKGTVLELKNVYAQVEYISSPYWREYFDRINEISIPYTYDECSVLYKALPLEEQSIRLDNIKGGNTPDYLFLAIAPTSSITGDTKFTSTNFSHNQVKEISITLNGNHCHGYPMVINYSYPVWPYFKFYDVIGKLLNIDSPNQQSITSFKDNIIFAHKFEGEESMQGWLGVNLTLDSINGFTDQNTLG